MEKLKAQEIHKQMRELCNWKLRTLLGFDYVEQITSQILNIENEEDMKNYIRVSSHFRTSFRKVPENQYSHFLFT
jgi:hypothetical protein